MHIHFTDGLLLAGSRKPFNAMQPGICETTPGVASYAGYIELPASQRRNYTSHTFFWFFEARRTPEKAPLVLWLNGGPGAASMQGALRENGPCFVADDSNSTYLNPWSWNNEANVLYVDQPLHTGFSYSALRNITWAPSVGELGETRLLRPEEEREVMQNGMVFVGTMSDRLAATTVNSTGNAMRALWDFLQVWLADFPGYKTSNDEVGIWGES
ncbi:MAG: hypothetical protein Q9214_006519, partial [Letrouitia sp. 1 TL-2023]